MVESMELQVIHFSFFGMNGLLSCRKWYYFWRDSPVFKLYILHGSWVFTLHITFKILPHPTRLLPIYIVIFHCRPFKYLGLSLPLYQTTLMLMSLKPQVLLVSLEVWHQSLPPPPLGPILPAWSFKVLSWALCLATTVAGCVNVCQTEW